MSINTIDQLRLFIITVETASFTKTAEKLQISIPAVSKQITQLEKNLKITLFHRSTRKLELTPAGYAIYEKCKAILTEIASLDDFAKSIQTEHQGTLHIFATPIIDTFLIDPLLKNFMELYPKLNIDLTVSTHSPN